MADRTSDLTLSDLITGNRRANPFVGGARAAVGQGLMMGWGDEAEAWLRSKLGEGEYNDIVKRIRKEYGTYSEQNPITSALAEFGGGVAPGVAAMFVPGAQPAGAAQLTAAGTSALSRLAARPVVKSTAAGATTGAVSGAGSAEEGERGSGAVSGGVIGAGIGAVLPAGIRTAGGVKDWLTERLFPSAEKSTQRAAQKMTQAMAETKLTPQQIERKMRQDRALGVPSTIANVDPALADLAETVAQRTGAGTRKVEKAIGQQQAGAKERTYQQVRKGMQPGQYYDEQEQLLQDLRSKSAPAYKQAYAVGEVDDPQITAMLELPQFRGAWNTARSIAEADAAAAKVNAMRSGQPFNADDYKLREVYSITRDMKTGQPIGVEVTGQVPDVRTLDYMKRALDAQIAAGYRSDNAATVATANAMKDLRNALRDRTKEVVPEYAKALQTYKGDKEILDALEAGYNQFGKLDHEEVIKMVGAMSPAEKEAFRTGVVRDLYGKMFNTSRNINAAGLLEAPEMQAKLQPLFDSPAQYRLFQAAIERESQLFKQANQILRGSQTGKRKVMQEQFEDTGDNFTQAAAQAITGGWMSSLTGMASRALYKTSMTEEMADKLAGMLMARDPREVAAAVKILEDYAQRAAPRAAAATRKEVGATTGAAISFPPAPVGEVPEGGIESSLEPRGRSSLELEFEEEERQKPR
jgi:hypothetical protein